MPRQSAGIRRSNNVSAQVGMLSSNSVPKTALKGNPVVDMITPRKISTTKMTFNSEIMQENTPSTQAKVPAAKPSTEKRNSAPATTVHGNMSVAPKAPTKNLLDECIKLMQAKQYRSSEMLTMFYLSSVASGSTNNENEVYAQRAAAYEILGDCAMHQDQLKRALSFYRKSLSNLRSLRLPLSSYESQGSLLVQTANEANLKLKEARALVRMGDAGEAASILESSIPRSHPLRTFVISMELGKYYLMGGRYTDAKHSYLDALSRNPYALEAIEKLVMLQVERSEVMKVVHVALKENNPENGKENHMVGNNEVGDIPFSDIVTAYFYADRSTTSHQMNALSQWKKLHADYPHNIYLLLQIALLQSKHPTCDVAHAASLTFQKIRSIDPNFVEGMDYYAALLAKQLNISELGKLSNDLLLTNNKRPETWNALALYHEVCGDSEKALAFLEKSISFDKKHAFSYQLKGTIILGQGRYDLAGQCFSRANSIKKDISSYEGMVESYLNAKRYKEAICTAKEAMSFAPRDSRALTLVGLALSKASLFSRDSGGKERSKKALKKAISLDPLALRPLLALAELYLEDSEFEVCTSLLRKAIEDGGDTSISGTSPALSTLYDRQVVLFTKLASVYSMSKKYKEALSYYHKALSMNPQSIEAQRGIEQMENAMKGLDSISSGDHDGYEYIDYRDDM